MPDLLSELQEVFRDVLDNPTLRITRGSNGSNVKAWDSIAHIKLILAIEHQFGISLSLSELQELKNVGDMIDVMQQKLAEPAG